MIASSLKSKMLKNIELKFSYELLLTNISKIKRRYISIDRFNRYYFIMKASSFEFLRNTSNLNIFFPTANFLSPLHVSCL